MHRRTALFRAVFYWVSGLEFVVSSRFVPPHPSPLPQGGEGEREPIFGLFKI
jgi:hypothetical protein